MSAAHGYNNVPGLLKWLDKYPYGCIEQTTSRAMPLLVFNDLSDLAGLPQRPGAARRACRMRSTPCSTCRTMPAISACGLRARDADPWISVFALDFLYQAKDKGYVVPNDALQARRDLAASTAASSDSNDDTTRAYAFYVLARIGQVNLSRSALLQRHARAGDEHRHRARR